MTSALKPIAPEFLHWRRDHRLLGEGRGTSIAAIAAVASGALSLGGVQAYRKVREWLWLREEIELLPFPPKR